VTHRRIAGKLVIATHNPGKLKEMHELLEPYGIAVVSAGELGLGEPEETGTSFRANARIKAVAAARASGLPAFADDSGLAVDALGGEPGIYSARWAGPAKDFAHAMQTVEDKLQERGAQLARNLHQRAQGAVRVGAVRGQPDGRRGVRGNGRHTGCRRARRFGYDLMFPPDGHTRPSARWGLRKHGRRRAGIVAPGALFVKLAEACLPASGR
jgi:XTP/dITP diphosphohydrolase